MNENKHLWVKAWIFYVELMIFPNPVSRNKEQKFDILDSK